MKRIETVAIPLGKGSNKKKKVGNFPYLRDPPAPPSKVGNLFMIFFQHPRVKFALFIDVIYNIGTREKGVQGYSY